MAKNMVITCYTPQQVGIKPHKIPITTEHDSQRDRTKGKLCLFVQCLDETHQQKPFNANT